MSKIWRGYFTKSANIAFCNVEGCKYSKDFPPTSSTTTLISHLKRNHQEQYKKYLAEKELENEKKEQQHTIKRSFQAGTTSTSNVVTIEEELPSKQPRIFFLLFLGYGH